MNESMRREGATYVCDCPGKPLAMLAHEGRVIVLTDVGVFEMLPGESFLRPVKFMTEQESAEFLAHQQAEEVICGYADEVLRMLRNIQARTPHDGTDSDVVVQHLCGGIPQTFRFFVSTLRLTSDAALLQMIRHTMRFNFGTARATA